MSERATKRGVHPSDAVAGSGVERWRKLENAELTGADYALRLLSTSPAVSGRAADILTGLIIQVRREMYIREADGSLDMERRMPCFHEHATKRRAAVWFCDLDLGHEGECQPPKKEGAP